MLQPNALGINLHIEYMDTKKTRFDDDYKKLLAELLEYKYTSIKPSLIIVCDNNTYSGITADFVKLMNEKIGLKLDVAQYKNWAEVIQLTKQQKIDMWGAAARSVEREKYMRFTDPYIRLPAVIIVRKETQGSLTLSDLKGKQVVVIQNYATQKYIEEHYPDLSLIPVPDIETGLRMVSFGSADAIVANDRRFSVSNRLKAKKCLL